METACSHRDLVAWQEAIRLAEMVYRETSKFPNDQLWGITSQLRHTAVSIPSTIAEGAASATAGQLLEFLGVASGRRSELDTQMLVASRLGLVGADSPIFRQLEIVGQLLASFRRAVLAGPKTQQA